jgi:hypothetical protein
MDRVHDPGWTIVQGKLAMYSEILHEGEFVEGKVHRRIVQTLRPGKNVLKVEWLILLAKDEDRCENVCGQVHNLSAHEGKKAERRVVSAITHTRKVVGRSEHGFHIRTAKETEGI